MRSVMKKTTNVVSRCWLVILVMIIGIAGLPFSVFAKELEETIPGKYYEFDEDNKYEITNSTPITGYNPLGELTITGEYNSKREEDIPRYDVGNEGLSLIYSYDRSVLELPEDKWHIGDDGGMRIDGFELENSIKKGTIVVQTSFDGENWNTASEINNIFSEEYDCSEPIYTTTAIQHINGCYYRIVVAYKWSIVTGKSSFLFWETNDYEYKKNAEVYEFYVENSDEKTSSDPTLKPRKILGEKYAYKPNSGFSEQIEMDKNDPHYGLSLGNFSINGYTSEKVMDDGKDVFLKNVGDKVTLWFNLDADIKDLKGDGDYYIVEDKNGYDKRFEVPQQNFKRGALIIGYIDHENTISDPIVYTDFLAANASPGADTKAVLFEEGDYAVALDYSIGKKGLLGSEHDYSIFFTFSIRNGNTMFFPFDVATRAELSNNDITPNGFSIDMAKSRYLNINVKRVEIVEGETGHIEDIRFNRPARDGEEYTEEGMYIVDVTNQYTGEQTEKVFFVGNDPFMTALSKSGKTIKELDALLAQGYTIESDGSLLNPSIRQDGGNGLTNSLFGKKSVSENVVEQNINITGSADKEGQMIISARINEVKGLLIAVISLLSLVFLSVAVADVILIISLIKNKPKVFSKETKNSEGEKTNETN